MTDLPNFIRARREELGMKRGEFEDLLAVNGIDVDYGRTLRWEMARQVPKISGKLVAAIASALDVHKIEVLKALGLITQEEVDEYQSRK